MFYVQQNLASGENIISCKTNVLFTEMIEAIHYGSTTFSIQRSPCILSLGTLNILDLNGTALMTWYVSFSVVLTCSRRNLIK
jgi:hypothetical protein